MLIDAQYNFNLKKLVISYIDKECNPRLKYYDWGNPQKFQNCDISDPDRDKRYTSWDGRAVKSVSCSFPNRYSIYEFLDALPEKERTEIFEYHEPSIYFIDIETEIIDGFPDAKSASTRVLAISVVFDDKIILMGIKELSAEAQKRILDKTNEYFAKFDLVYKLQYLKYPDEFAMLKYFFENMVPHMNCLSGWNFINYDWTFLINRARKLVKTVNGAELTINVNLSSPTKRLYKAFLTDYELPEHKLIYDYMQLYEAFDTSIKVKESSSLDYVSYKLVGVNKIKYTGSLQKLYEDDYEKYMYYNAVDSVLVHKIHLARNYISIIYAVSSLATIKALDVMPPKKSALASLAITEGLLRHKFRDIGIVMFKDEDRIESDEEGLAGGWVKSPVVGFNRWVVVYDFASLYPTTQRQWFIAPENYVGAQHPVDKSICTNNKSIDLSKHVICTNGDVFMKRNSPTIMMLKDVYADRKKAKKVMMSKKTEYEKIMNEIAHLESQL